MKDYNYDQIEKNISQKAQQSKAERVEKYDFKSYVEHESKKREDSSGSNEAGKTIKKHLGNYFFLFVILAWIFIFLFKNQVFLMFFLLVVIWIKYFNKKKKTTFTNYSVFGGTGKDTLLPYLLKRISTGNFPSDIKDEPIMSEDLLKLKKAYSFSPEIFDDYIKRRIIYYENMIKEHEQKGADVPQKILNNLDVLKNFSREMF